VDASEIQLAEVGLLLHFVRTQPGADLLIQRSGRNRSVFVQSVLGEWDALRLALRAEMFSPTGSQPWPARRIRVQNQQRITSHLFNVDGLTPRAITKTPDGWSFTDEFLSPKLQITFVICAKLHPVLTASLGVRAEAAVVRWIQEKALSRRIMCLPGGGVGWQEIVLTLRVSSLEEGRDFVADLYSTTAGSVVGLESVSSSTPLVAKTVSYPCVAPLTEGDHPSGAVRGARILLDIRPGSTPQLSPTATKRRKDARLFEPDSLAGEFGEYDLSISFPEGAQLADVLAASAELRRRNATEPQKGWLVSTTTLIQMALEDETLQRAATTTEAPETYLNEPAALTNLAGHLARVRWGSVHPVHLERLFSIIARVDSYSTDPLLADSVSAVERYLRAFLLRVISDLSSQQRKSRRLWVDVQEPDLEHVCALLEYALNQRAEGLQQFLYNALPTSYYGRGGVNRVVAGADCVLQEVSSFFGLRNPGFTVFGSPSAEGFQSHGPIVVAPTTALFDVADWWLLYHEAGNYIEELFFGPAREGDARARFVQPESRKLVPDVIAFALPFRLDYPLFAREMARRLVMRSVHEARKTAISLAVRILTIRILYGVFEGLLEDDFVTVAFSPEDPPTVARFSLAWDQQLRAREMHLRSLMPIEGALEEAVSLVTSEMRQAATSRFGPEAAAAIVNFPERILRLRLADQCANLRAFWREVREASDEVAERGTQEAFLALAAMLFIVRMQRHPEPLPLQSNGALHSDVGSLSELVNRALHRRCSQARALPDLRAHACDILTAWDMAVRGTWARSHADVEAAIGLERPADLPLGGVVTPRNLRAVASVDDGAGRFLRTTYAFSRRRFVSAPARTEAQEATTASATSASLKAVDANDLHRPYSTSGAAHRDWKRSIRKVVGRFVQWPIAASAKELGSPRDWTKEIEEAVERLRNADLMTVRPESSYYARLLERVATVVALIGPLYGDAVVGAELTVEEREGLVELALLAGLMGRLDSRASRQPEGAQTFDTQRLGGLDRTDISVWAARLKKLSQEMKPSFDPSELLEEAMMTGDS